ncbi:MAG TPA: 30S ribosomal protein S19 [Candidatus Nanoarchaeia archaeon]|nr:30S ribosomal protein S19 [Candidatus Nanoarchaeia archaeon]
MADAVENAVIMKSKDVYYRGINVEDLKKMDVREIAKYLPSRSRRTVLRHFDEVEKFVKRCEDTIKAKKKIKTHLRDIVIVPRMVGMNIQVYNGKTFNDVAIVAEMIGHRLGEFSMTRGKVTHGSAGIGATKGSKTAKK